MSSRQPLKSLLLTAVLALSWASGASSALASSSSAGVAGERYFFLSDLDDTAKISNVGNTPDLVRRSLFSKKAFAGMPELYSELERERVAAHPEHESTDRLTFVSNSDHRMTGMLSKSLAKLGFPESRFALRDWFKKPKLETLGEHAIRNHPLASHPRFISKFLYAEKRLLESPGARATLIGDDTELDYEIYKALKDLHPGKVGSIYIHRVTGRADIDPSIATHYQDAFELALHLHNEGKLSSQAAARVGYAIHSTWDSDRLVPRFQKFDRAELSYPETPGGSDELEWVKATLSRRMVLELIRRGDKGVPSVPERYKGRQSYRK